MLSRGQILVEMSKRKVAAERAVIQVPLSPQTCVLPAPEQEACMAEGNNKTNSPPMETESKETATTTGISEASVTETTSSCQTTEPSLEIQGNTQ